MWNSVCIICWFLVLLLAGQNIAGPAGKLEICPEHRYYFRDGGRHVVLVGASDRSLFHLWQNMKGFSWRKYLDDIASAHLNYVRQDVCSWGGLLEPQKYPAQLSNAAWPFVRSGPGVAVDGKPRFDLNRFDQSYFDIRLKPFLREAAKRGIYVELTLFEEYRKQREFDQSLYAEENNINQLGLHPRNITSNTALHNPRLMTIQHAFIDKVLVETSEFYNVIYEISNESGGDRWVAHHIDYIHKPPRYPRQIVSAGEQSSSFDPRKGANDIIIKHRGGGGLYATDNDIYCHHKAMLNFRAGKPISHNEYFLFANRSTADVNFPRKMMWANFTAGGHSNFYDFTFWRGTGRTVHDGMPSRSPPREILLGGKYLLDFLTDNKVKFWLMQPQDELASVKDQNCYVFTLASPNAEYICYLLGNGPVAVLLHLPRGLFKVRWYNPKSGQFVTLIEQFKSQGPTTIQSPAFEWDIVLYVRAESGTKS